VSVAVKAVDCDREDFTVKAATPELFVEALAGRTVIPELGAPARVTVLLGTGLERASRSVTVIVEVVTPSAVTELRLASTVEFPALTVPETN
jgi:hypothetical protein